MTVFDSNIDDQEWLESYERGEWHSVDRLQREVRRYQEYASAWLKENRQVNLTLPVDDFEMLEEKARETGISYQTLLAELVHEFVTEPGPS
jgi:predicted DNA binding CopG/RHH family protein